MKTLFLGAAAIGATLTMTAPASAASLQFYMAPVTIDGSSDLVTSLVNNCTSTAYLTYKLTNVVSGKEIYRKKRRVRRGRGAEFRYAAGKSESVYATMKIRCDMDQSALDKASPYLAATLRDTSGLTARPVISLHFDKIEWV